MDFRQFRFLRIYAEQMDFEIVGSSLDIGGGLDFKRFGLMNVMKEASDGKFDVLLIKQLGCIGRNKSMTLEFLQELEQIGIKVFSPLEGEISFSKLTRLSEM